MAWGQALEACVCLKRKRAPRRGAGTDIVTGDQQVILASHCPKQVVADRHKGKKKTTRSDLQRQCVDRRVPWSIRSRVKKKLTVNLPYNISTSTEWNNEKCQRTATDREMHARSKELSATSDRNHCHYSCDFLLHALHACKTVTCLSFGFCWVKWVKRLDRITPCMPAGQCDRIHMGVGKAHARMHGE